MWRFSSCRSNTNRAGHPYWLMPSSDVFTCVCLLHNTFKASVLCHDDAAALCAACVSYSCRIYCCYHPTSLEAPSQGSAHCQLLIYDGDDWVHCCMCIIHANSVILILDFVRIQLVVTWLICRRWACHIILCSYEPLRSCVRTCMRQGWVE